MNIGATQVNKVYGLVDPRTQELRYVGKTVKSLKARLSCVGS